MQQRNRIRLGFQWVFGLALCALIVFPLDAIARGIEEFDRGFGVWKVSPKKVSGTKTPGWQLTEHADEKAAYNTPTPTKYTYYWKLTRTYDLTDVEKPELDLKFQFMGGDYSEFRVLIGDSKARRAKDFQEAFKRNEPTGLEEGFFPIHEYAGQKIKVQVVLKKSSGKIAKGVGLYLHRVGINLPDVSIDVDDDPNKLLVGAFNVQVFGRKKVNKADVAMRLVEILKRYDLVLFQEIRDSSQTAIYALLEQLNAASGGQYEMTISDRLGRSNSKEQYAYIYKKHKLAVMDAYHYDDGEEPDNDTFEREPYIARFKAAGHDFDFSVVGIHTSPKHARTEVDALTDVYTDAVAKLGDEDVILMGDFNASCNYVRASHFSKIRLRTDERFTWHIDDDADTTTSATVCAYDRFVTTGDATARVEPGSARVFLFDLAYQLDHRLTKKISDHYPIEITIDLGN